MPARASTPDQVEEPAPSPAARPLRPGWVAGALIAIAAAMAGGVAIGIASHGNDGKTADAPVAEDSVDVGFSRAMRDHHAQAVEMSVLARDATTDPQVRALALDVLLTQQQQLGQMYGWLAAWGLPQAGAADPMAWMAGDEMADMGHESAAGTTDESSGERVGAPRMPGMATDEQLWALRQAEGRRADRIYLQLMIPHHEAGVEMAQYAAENATQPQVQRLAQSIVDSQRAELRVLRSMLADRGGPVSGL